jgi:surfeit locus 1 family protein
MNGAPSRARRGLVVPSLFTLVALAILLSLGTWQVQRKAWKEGLIASISARLDAPPTNVPPPETWGRLDAAAMEYRRVVFPVEFLNDQEALVYTSGSTFRTDVSGPGYWVFTPARLTGGSMVVVNRGFVPEARKDPASRAEGQVSGAVNVTGVMRWPEPRGLFTPNDDAAHNLWFVRDQTAMAPAKKWGRVAPFYVEQEAPPAPGGLPQVGKVRPILPNNHLGYAITWYGLALMLVGVFGFWLRSQRRAPSSV